MDKLAQSGSAEWAGQEYCCEVVQSLVVLWKGQVLVRLSVVLLLVTIRGYSNGRLMDQARTGKYWRVRTGEREELLVYEWFAL
jgi:hypothetical protein